MSVIRSLSTGVAVVAAANISGHADAYGIAQRDYFWTRIVDNQGQANLEFAQTIQSICGGSGNPNDKNNTPAACHAVTIVSRKTIIGKRWFDSLVRPHWRAAPL